MNRLNCRLLTIVSEASLEEDLCERILSLGASGYTVTDARGSGSRGTRSADWLTAGNVRIEVLCSAEVADKITASLKHDYYENYAMVIFDTETHVLRPEKFS
jgi:hypothetical protein